MDSQTLLIVAIIGGSMLILDAIFVGIILVNQRKSRAVKTWPTTTGAVTSSYLERRRSSSNRGSVNYPVVEYSYKVGGTRYRSSRIAPGMEVGGSGAGKVIERYPEGGQVTVFYNPQDPADAVLEATSPAQWVMWLVIGIANVMLCSMATLFAFVM